MPVYQELVDLNEQFHQLSETPIILNDLLCSTEEDRLKIRNLVQTRYKDDQLSLLPSCHCGKSKVNYALGTICPYCHTPVVAALDNTDPLIWFRAPKGIKALMNPQVYIMLTRRFSRGEFSLIHWLTDRDYSPNCKIPEAVNVLQDMKIPRGYNEFIENFDSIMNVLFNLKDFRFPRKKYDHLKDLIVYERHKIFSEYIPLPHKSLVIIEETNTGTYIDTIIIQLLDAIDMVSGIDSDECGLTPRGVENRVARFTAKLSKYYEKATSKLFEGKPGAFRKHFFASRTRASFRTVVTSITAPHDYDECHVPWCAAVTTLRPQLMNKLLRRGYSHNDAVGILLGHVTQYSPLLDDLLKELIAESPYKGIPVIFHRNKYRYK